MFIGHFAAGFAARKLVPGVSLGWLFLGGAFLVLRKDRRGALVVAALVVSHWLLDAIVHQPDLPLYPGAPPPSVEAIAWVGQAQWLLVLWAYWVDNHRRPATRP